MTRSGVLFYYPKTMRFSDDITKRVNDSQFVDYTGMSRQNWNRIINDSEDGYAGVLSNIRMLEWDVVVREKMIEAYIGHVLLPWNKTVNKEKKRVNHFICLCNNFLKKIISLTTISFASRTLNGPSVCFCI